jgi:hypothetical protein
MHSDFSEWFRAAGMELHADELQKRWAGVDAFEVGRDEVVSLVEIFFGFFAGKDAFLAGFRKVFQDADASFRMRDNERELSVLAGAVLVTVMEEGSMELGDLTALALVACAAQNLRAAPCVPNIPERAAKHLARRTVNRGKLDSDDESEADENQLQVVKLQRNLDVIGEETNVLWWVFGESSRDTNERWSEYAVPRATIMAGKELANLTRIAPGPASASALLDRVIKYSKTKPPALVAVKDAIVGVPLDWRQKYVKDQFSDALANLCPVSHGIKLSVDLVEGNAWVPALATSTKVQREGKIAPHLLAYQVFIECMLASLWSKMK